MTDNPVNRFVNRFFLLDPFGKPWVPLAPALDWSPQHDYQNWLNQQRQIDAVRYRRPEGWFEPQSEWNKMP